MHRGQERILKEKAEVMREPLISVIVPVYNVEGYVGKCITSLLQQTYPRFEAILVDDGSMDNSGKICDQYARQDARIRVIHQAHGGANSARNAGLSAMRGEWVAFVDPDDWVEALYLEELLRPLRRDEAIDMVIGCFYLREDREGITISQGKKGAEGYLSETEKLRQMFDGVYWDWSLCCKLYRAALWKDFRFTERVTVGEDMYANWQILQRAARVFYTPSQRYHYVWRAGSQTNVFSPEGRFGFVEILQEIEATPAARGDAALYSAVQTQLLDVHRDVVRRMALIPNGGYEEKLRKFCGEMSERARAAVRACVREPTMRRVMEERTGSYSTLCRHYREFIDRLRQIAEKGALYLYGAGTYAMPACEVLAAHHIPFRAFVVSDDRKRSHSPDGDEHPVLFLRQVPTGESRIGMLICLALRDTETVLPGIRAKGIDEIFYW